MKKLRKIISVVSTSIILSICSFSSYAEVNSSYSNIEENSDGIINYFSDHKYGNILSAEQLNVRVVEENASIPELSIEASELLKLFNKEIDNIYSSQIIYDNSLQREVTRIVTDNSLIDFDKYGNLVEYRNFEDFSIVDKDKRNYTEKTELAIVDYRYSEKKDLKEIIDEIECTLDIKDYKMTDCGNGTEGVWTLTWCKEYENGLINPFENVNVIVDAKDGSIMLYGTNEIKPNAIESNIKEEEAIEYACKYLNDNENKKAKVQLTFTKPFSYDLFDNLKVDYVNLCYNVDIEGIAIQIDALTGDIINTMSTYSIEARSMVAFNEGYGGQNKATLAHDAFERLGYSQDYGDVYWRFYQTDIDWILSRPDMYALYLNCHGKYFPSDNASVIADDENIENEYWHKICYSNSNYGTWRFVFLDACDSSLGNLWANAFHANYSGECFIGWNLSVKAVVEYDFVNRFFPRLGYMSVHDAVVDSLWESREAGWDFGEYVCDPGFNGDVNYYGWAW